MKRNLFRSFLVVAITTSVVTACVRDNFKYYGYEDQLEGYFPVDSIDSQHTWTLTKKCSSFVKGNVSDAAKIQILSADPFTTQGAEILAEASTSSNISKQMNYIVPASQEKIYVAVRTKSGKYLRLVPATPGRDEISVGGAEPTGNVNAIAQQKIFYCFEEDYPNPGDWDYNDIVLSITKEPAEKENTVALHVTLVAAGTLNQIGAAIRLPNYQYDQVTITQDDATTFYRYPDRERMYIKESDVQLKGLSGEPVINLFDDAHLAFYKLGEDGNPVRRYFNTIENPNSSNNGAIQPPITVTYYIEFGNEYEARNFTLAELDPFILVRYGTSGENYWEVHTYPYKLSEALYKYYNGAASSYNNGFSWGLAVPYVKFRYPFEGVVIGERKNTIVSGAYQKSGHSFGEWILDRNTAQDWYLYPATGAVY